MSVYRVGLTGGLASGKSTVAEYLAACGAEIFDADAVVRALTARGSAALEQLRQTLGGWVLTADGDYHRALVREKIFAQPELRQQVEAVLHPLVQKELRQRLYAAASPYAVAVIPLLFEYGNWEDFFHHTVTVDCTHAAQVARARQRDATQDAERIIAVQLSPAERCRRADEVLENNGDLAQLAAVSTALHQRLCAAAAAHR